MSGGHFEYNQRYIDDIVDSIDTVVRNNGRKLTEEELRESYSYRSREWYDDYPEDLYIYEYPDNVINEFKKGIAILKQAKVYAQRIDWLLSGDDGEESFITRLNEELNELKEKRYDNGIKD